MAVTGTTWSAKPGTTSTAELRERGVQINTALASAGLVQTSDTGQINWTTINWVSGAQTWGYEVWRFNDPLQATKPVFVRISYVQGSSANAFDISAQIGTATDGAGTLSSAPNTNVSVTTSRVFCKSGSGTNPTNVRPSYVYGDGSAVVVALFTDLMTTSTGCGGILYIERVRDTDGSPLGDGVVIYWLDGSSTSSVTQVVLFNNLFVQPGTANSVGWLPNVSLSTLFTSGVIGADMYTVPWFTGFSPRLGAPSTMIVGFYKTDMAGGNTFTCRHYGANRTFVAINPSIGGAFNYSTGMSSGTYVFAMAIRTS